MTTTQSVKNNEEAENAVIDVDSYSFSYINTNTNTNKPKSRAKKPRAAKGLKSDMSFPMKAYIFIDDDDAESPVNHSYVTPMSLSKNKRMYPGRGPTTHAPNFQLDDDDEDDDKNNNKSVVNEKEDQQHTDATDGARIESVTVDEEEKLNRQAQEEEMAARQLALKLQAEEAKQQRRLLKRKKAQDLRLLDIKKRQQQRVEEIRESQKQDEENMNMKEMYRIEVQQDLEKLEMTCHDMASLLRGLGILVNSLYATSDEVHAAYKRALLRFHPDRACSRSDMRQQVEAEEKFKLISRMKKKVSGISRLK